MSAVVALREATSTLIVPGGLAESLAFREAALGRGTYLIGASSLRNDPAAGEYDDWYYLPTIHDPEFAASFHEIIRRHSIKAVFCPHPIMHARLEELYRSGDPGFDLLNPPPQKAHERKVVSDFRRAGEVGSFLYSDDNGTERLGDLEVAALFRACEAIVGQSDETKLAAIMAIFAGLPVGDVVEVGGFWGRSAYLLTWLAARFEIGPVLVVDPWSAEEALQSSAAALVQRDTHAQDWELIHQGFLLNLLPLARGRLGYLRMTSAEAHTRYDEAPFCLESPPFGNLEYSGEIALLHIDGNHDAAAVALDISLWVQHIRPGGWLVLDDYVWPHGDGPARAGDALLSQLGEEAACSFVAGKALFICMT